ncbi:MAG: replication protein [Candidatus Methylumidiphilus sp.]
MTTKPPTKQEKPFSPPESEDFHGLQLDLFRAFLCNGPTERERLSNTFDLWDSVPRYSVSRQAMDKERKVRGFLDLMEINFHYRGTTLQAVIQPARVREKKTGVTKDYYPSANEELIEDALRKIAAEQNNGYFDKNNYRSGVVFTLYQLRDELKKRGHTRSYQQIALSLNILARSTIEIRTLDGKNGEGFTVNPYFTGLSAVSRTKLIDDPDAKWIVQFHPLVTQAIDALTYRQYNYAQMMSHSTQLARWLHKQLSLKFTFASLMTSFDIRYSTIKRDSALLEGYSRSTAAIEALDGAFAELKAGGVLMMFKKSLITGLRGKIEDVLYTLTASRDFIGQMKAANKRESLAKEKAKGSVESLSDPKKR